MHIIRVSVSRVERRACKVESRTVFQARPPSTLHSLFRGFELSVTSHQALLDAEGTQQVLQQWGVVGRSLRKYMGD